MQSSVILGVDIGGSHITAALVDISNRKIVENSLRRERIDSQGSTEDIINAWAGVLKESLLFSPNSKIVSVAMPGPFDYENGLSLITGLNKYESLYNLNLRDLLLKKLQPLAEEIIFTNDAACFLQGEVFCGAAKDHDRVLGFTLGTGFGSATFENQSTEEAGYWKYPFADSICENYFSSRWFVKRYFELFDRKVANVKEIVESAGTGNEQQIIFAEFSHNLSSFLIPLIKNKNYTAIVFGGNIAKAACFFLPAVQSALTQNGINVELVVSELGESSAIIGAASLIQSTANPS
ncbi:ROK family protein [Desertivirga brevis]|uniref:ROK family protein n=1 Tax=Desertivirga brevis TaxID=2810310 RepID=UPI001A971F02|nr:ROK family protein [Pedobacter sp. SYSU D00873]